MFETSPDAAAARPARNAAELIQQLWAAGEPIRLTINGKLELLVPDVASCEQLLDLVDRLETIEGIRIGLEEMKAGKGVPLEEAFDELRRKSSIALDEHPPQRPAVTEI